MVNSDNSTEAKFNVIEKVAHLNEILAIIVRAGFRSPGVNFVTPDDYSLQLAYMSRPEGYEIQPHLHRRFERKSLLTQEVLFIRKGRLRVDFYNAEQSYLTSRVVAEGDVILLATGGHGFQALDPVEMIEVKQGPYAKDMDKIRFEPVSKELVNFDGAE